MTATEHTWLAAYLYYAEPWEEFLVNAVKPFVDGVFEREEAVQYFFIRYWERGPHIRLRFKGDPETLENQLKPRLDDYFNNYFKQHPSEREDPKYLENLPADQQWFPNNSVQHIPYEPETERYGGPAGMVIGEKQFESSSRAILEIIEECDTWDYDRALGAAIQLHLGFAHAMGMDLDEAGKFYDRIAYLWFSRAYAYAPDTPEEEIKERQAITRKAFEDNFNRQKEILVPYHRTVWEAFSADAEFEQEWLNRWLLDMTTTYDELRHAQQQGALQIPTWFRTLREEEVAEEKVQRWAILESYIHMTNNRLGIMNRDEAYLGYLIKESMAAL